jgi:hypothetical protein
MVTESTTVCIVCGDTCSRLTSKGRVRKMCEPCSHRPGKRKMCEPCSHRPGKPKRDCPMRRKRRPVLEFETSFPMPPKTAKLRCVHCLGLIPEGCSSITVCSPHCGKRAYKLGRNGGRCVSCDGVLPPYYSKYCGQACRMLQRQADPVPCHRCGESFIRNNQSYTCGDCAMKRRSNAEARRRKACRDGDSSIHWLPLGERDGWKCHLCGLKVLQTAGIAQEPKGATIDHLVPVSAGGVHEWSNVALAHRHCNNSRQAGGVAQLRLVG